jgi:H/ACA ribonucleoprotein complex subunit 4
LKGMSSKQPPWRREIKLVVKREAETSPEYGKQPNMRSVPELLNMGTVNLDKQRGPTSHEVAHTVKKILGGGTLEKFGEIPPSPAYCL